MSILLRYIALRPPGRAAAPPLRPHRYRTSPWARGAPPLARVDRGGARVRSQILSARRVALLARFARCARMDGQRPGARIESHRPGENQRATPDLAAPQPPRHPAREGLAME